MGTSYHFNEDKSYISYALFHGDQLDNGEPMPAKKFFENESYDPVERAFKATINWRGDATAFGYRKWVFEMWFA